MPQSPVETLQQDPKILIDQIRALFVGRSFEDSSDLIRTNRERDTTTD